MPMPIQFELEAHEAFERLVGGPARGFRLLQLWVDTANPVGGTSLWRRPTHHDVFRQRARRDGYTDAAINAFLELQ